MLVKDKTEKNIVIYKKLKDYGFNTDNRTYLVAEIGLNHGGDLETAKKLIESASRTGADAVKFQTYITEKRVPEKSPLFRILKKCELPFAAFKVLKDHAALCNVEFFSTPFDEESVDLLESIKCPIYKIASFDVVNHRLLKKIAATGKPITISVGISTLNEIEAAYAILKSKTGKIAMLHCVSSYPTKEEDANLSAMQALKSRFDCVLGQSDHTGDIYVPLLAIAAGAQVIEKHYKIDDYMDCVDAPVSITEKRMCDLVKEARRIEKIMGEGKPGPLKSELGSKVLRRYTA